jgi:hypothetical protein
MSTSAEHRPAHDFPEGLTIFTDAAGIEIRVNDYHARPLTLTWTMLEALRREARAVPHRSGEKSIGR